MAHMFFLVAVLRATHSKCLRVKVPLEQATAVKHIDILCFVMFENGKNGLKDSCTTSIIHERFNIQTIHLNVQ